MEKPKIKDIWLDKDNTTERYCIRIDWDNDYYNLVVIDPPHSAEQVFRAFQRLLPYLINDPHLNGMETNIDL